MKKEQISEHIWSLKSWMLIPITVWVVVEEDGVTLVDAGASFMAKGILKFLEQLQAGPLKRIVLTHGHSDHTGSVKKILEHYQVPVYAHGIEIPYIEGAMPYPRRKKAEQTLTPGIPQKFAEDGSGNLEAVESLKLYFTPGHSPGHVVFHHEQDNVLLTGDLFTSKKGKLNKPMAMFTADMAEAVRSSDIVRQVNPKRLEVCHGGPVFNPAEQLEEYIRTTTRAIAIPNGVVK